MGFRLSSEVRIKCEQMGFGLSGFRLLFTGRVSTRSWFDPVSQLHVAKAASYTASLNHVGVNQREHPNCICCIQPMSL